ncbi:MAG: hypothetical protein JW829_13125 [Pirellulales bacterium]|nr:hypothetical protein [Pirellulales bacterium]
MKYNVLWLAVPIFGLAACLLVVETHAQSPDQVPVTDVYYSSAGQAASMASHVIPESSGECGPCDAVYGGEGGLNSLVGLRDLMGLKDLSGQFFVGMDWLHVRADLSENVAYLEKNLATFTDTFHEIDMGYNDSYSLYGGYRTCECCGEVRFAFSRYRSGGCIKSPEVNLYRQFQAPLISTASTLDIGDYIASCSEVDARSYDLDFARTIPLGSELDDCSCCWCPAWDLKWFAGLRYADVGWIHAHDLYHQGALPPNSYQHGQTTMDFEGIGGRIGMEGRRYIGRSGRFSVFAKGAISLLLGDIEYTSIQYDVETPTIFPTQRASFKRIIPVTDIELGGAVHVRDNITVSAGYLLSSWHDLGIGDHTDFSYQNLPVEYDDANILGFDGFFVRAEVAY